MKKYAEVLYETFQEAPTPPPPPPPRPAGTADQGDCPSRVQVPIRDDQVLYFFNEKKGQWVYDIRRTPIPLPYPDLVFRGYHKDCGQTYAWLVKRGQQDEKGTRLPRQRGGVNKTFLEGLHKAEDKEAGKQTHTYTRRWDRRGHNDPDI